MTDDNPETPAERVAEPAHHEPVHSEPPAPPASTAPHETENNDLHHTVASLQTSLAELSATVAGLVADTAPVEKNDPAPTKKPWTHRYGGRKS